MAHKFVRNITGVRDINKQALVTNEQNDILSDDTHAYIRNGKKYHCLTDNIKGINTSQGLLVAPKTNQVTLPNFAMTVNHVPAGTDANVQIDGTNINLEGNAPLTLADAIKALQKHQIVNYIESTKSGATSDIVVKIKGDITAHNPIVILRDLVANADISIPAGNLGINYVADIDCTQITVSGVQALTSGKVTVDIELRDTTDRKTLFYSHRLTV